MLDNRPELWNMTWLGTKTWIIILFLLEVQWDLCLGSFSSLKRSHDAAYSWHAFISGCGPTYSHFMGETWCGCLSRALIRFVISGWSELTDTTALFRTAICQEWIITTTVIKTRAPHPLHSSDQLCFAAPELPYRWCHPIVQYSAKKCRVGCVNSPKPYNIWSKKGNVLGLGRCVEVSKLAPSIAASFCAQEMGRGLWKKWLRLAEAWGRRGTP